MFDRVVETVLSRHRWVCLFLACLVAALCLPGFRTLFPMDRDEPRFAQASKQMLETGDFVAIRFQDKARNKKPVGIYWMQAAAVAAGERLGVPGARTAIWLYRVPSLLGALASVLLTYWGALALTTRQGAFVAAVLMAATLLLVGEAHLAKTDAVLCATVVADMAVLARAWAGRADSGALRMSLCAVFWTAVAIGILVKGPITPMVPMAASIVLSVRVRSVRWLTRLRPGWGVAWCLLLVLPWFILIVRDTGTAFFTESIGRDMAGKIATAQELHGAPPGSYFAAFWVTAWPLAPFVVLAAPFIWRERRSEAVVFLLAWIIPVWLLFEAVPTKLPHYVLPIYPALAALVGCASTAGFPPTPVRRWRLIGFAALLLLIPGVLPLALVFAGHRLTTHIGAMTLALAVTAVAVAALAGAYAILSAREGRPIHATLSCAAASLAICAFCFGRFLNPRNADLIALSPRLAGAAHAALALGCRKPGFATVGDNEPSLVFLTSTDLVMTQAAGAASFMNAGACRVAFVVQSEEAAFRAALDGAKTRLASRVAGFNINGGKKLDIGVYVRQEDAR